MAYIIYNHLKVLLPLLPPTLSCGMIACWGGCPPLPPALSYGVIAGPPPPYPMGSWLDGERGLGDFIEFPFWIPLILNKNQ